MLNQPEFYQFVWAVTASDSVDIDPTPRALMADTGGVINIETLNGQSVSLTVLAGVIYPISVRKVKTGSTAGGIKAFA